MFHKSKTVASSRSHEYYKAQVAVNKPQTAQMYMESKQNGQVHLESKESGLWSEIGETDSKNEIRDVDHQASISYDSEEFEAEIQPVVISVYTNDAPPTSKKPNDGVHKTITPTTTITQDNASLNASMTGDTDGTLSTLPVRIIPVTNDRWDDDDTLTYISDDDDDYEDDLTEETRSVEDSHSASKDDPDNEKDDNLSIVPRPADVIWNDIYRNCGIQTAEKLTDRLVVDLPKQLSQYFLCIDRNAFDEDDDSIDDKAAELHDNRLKAIATNRSRSFPTAEAERKPVFVAIWDSSSADHNDGMEASTSDDYSDGKASF